VSAFADLHLHTQFSDGTFSPEELVSHAHSRGLAALALTDHDTMEGCVRTAIACRESSIEFIPGSELTAEQRGEEIHILGYLMDAENPKLLAELAKFQTIRQNRIYEIVQKLNAKKVPITAEAVMALANCRAPGRPHVARALVKAGHCATMDEAFERFLKKHRPAWVPKFKMSAEDAISLIHQAGGVAIMAHPGLNRSDDVILPMIEAGLDGIECFHSKHSAGMTEHYLQMAAENGVLVTGGSDCHGLSKGRPLIGTVRLDYGYVERLKERADKRKASPVRPGR
jgi:predicted metal-dependent phosphoesterase TrpH